MTFDGKAFGAEIVGVVKGFLKSEMAPIISRMEALEKRLDATPAPVDLSADIASLKTAVEALVIPELPDIPKMIDDALAERIDVEDMQHSIEDVVRMLVAEIPTPKDGKSVTVDDVAPLIASEIEKRVSELPKAKDGKDGRDGIGLSGALIDRSGELVVTFTNGETRNLGPVVGKDGNPGEPGRDGFNLEDFDASVMDDGRTVLLSFTGNALDYKVELGFPIMLYRGVFKDGQQYEKGDTVTWGGSLWHCDAERTTDKPDGTEKHWTLAAKRGRDGKDGTIKEERAIGPVRVGVPGKAD